MIPLFLPADRLDRLPKAVAARPDAVILDLEDGVAPGAKSAAREALARLEPPDARLVIRVNAAGTPWHADDIALCRRLAWPAAIMLAKAEETDVIASIAGSPIWALVETARGLDRAREIAAFATRLVFGSVDIAADLGCAHERAPLQAARSELVLASRLANREPPIDGVTLDFRDAAVATDDARHAAAMGFAGKLAIHPGQVQPIRIGFTPSEELVAWARGVLARGGEAGAAAVEGQMVDAPVRATAERILRFAVDPSCG